MSAEVGVEALRMLTNRHPDLIPEVELIILEIANATTFERVASTVFETLSELTMFDLARYNSADPFSHYTETEAAWGVLEETVQPFIEATNRLAKMGLVAAALTHCEGTLLGLYRSDREQVGDFLDWVPDDLPELAHEAVQALSPIRRRILPGSKLTAGKALKEFAREHLPEWNWLHK